jgi:predicted permease
MAFDSAMILLPLFLLIAGGFILSRAFHLSEAPLVRVVTDFFMPMLVFYSFCNTQLALGDIVRMAGAVTMVLAVMFGIAWLYCRWFNLNPRAVAPPLLFMNSGFLGIPIMKLWGGLSAMNLIIVYDQIQTFYIFTLGIAIITGSYRLSGLKEMICSPLIWAIVLGFTFNLSRIPIPSTLLHSLKFCGDAAPSLATFTVGMALDRYSIRLDRHVLIGVLIRIGLGFLVGSAVAMLFNFTGTAAVVVVVASALPAAVFSVVLPVRYGVNGQYPGAVLIISTILSLLTLPFLFQAAQAIFP